MQNEYNVSDLVTVNNRFARMVTLNFISFILSAIVLGAWFILWIIAMIMGTMGDAWGYGIILMGCYALAFASSSICYTKSKQYYREEYSSIKYTVDGEITTINIATNLMCNSWASKNNDFMFRTTDIIISYFLLEIFAIIASFFMVWVNIEAIQIVVSLGVEQEITIILCTISIILLVVSRVLIWAGTGLLVHNCRNIGTEYNTIMAERKRRNEAEQRIADESNLRATDVKQLLAESGFKFFLKYYPQLVRVGVRDVCVEEDYSPTEKAERLKAAKKLIDSGLAPAAAQQILEKFSDLLTSEEKALALRIAG